MRFDKRNSLLIYIIIMFLLVGVCSAKHIENRKLESYTTSYYLNFFNNILIPQIDEYIDNFNLIPYTQKKGEQLVSGVIEIIKNHVIANNILVKKGMHYPVTLIVVPPDTNELIVYYVNVSIPVIEYNPRGKITSVLVLSKNFFCGVQSMAPKQGV